MRLLSSFVKTFTLFKIMHRKHIPLFQHVSGKLRVGILCERSDHLCELL